jgi:hypothetical protein
VPRIGCVASDTRSLGADDMAEIGSQNRPVDRAEHQNFIVCETVFSSAKWEAESCLEWYTSKSL